MVKKLLKKICSGVAVPTIRTARLLICVSSFASI